MRLAIPIILSLLPSLAMVLPGGESGSISVEVFTSGREGYHTYRIPAVIQTAKGTLLAFCKGRREHGRDWGDIDLLVKRSRDAAAYEHITFARFPLSLISSGK